MRALLLSLLFLPSVFGVICRQGYFLINGQKCLRMYWDQMSQPAAESYCKNDGGTLVIIRNAIDNQAVYNFANQAGVSEIWIGLSCFDRNTTSSCFWDDASGTAVSYSNFIPGMAMMLGYCNMMFVTHPGYVAKWMPSDCNYKNAPYLLRPFVCEVPPTEPPCLYPPCGYVETYNGYGYLKSTESSLPIANGSDVARCRGWGNLVSIHSKMEVDYIRRLYRGTNTTRIYLGATSDISDRFEWTDGSQWDFNYMDPMSFQKGKCLAMEVRGYGLWSQVDCDQKLEYLCKRKLAAQPNAALPVALPVAEKTPEVLLDASNCNTTYYLAPGSISSFGYPNYNSPPSFCTWELRALGPYRLGMYFDFWATYGALNIYNESGENIGQFVGTYDRSRFSRYTLFNIARITFEPRPQTGSQVDRGFHAVIIAL